MTHLRSFAIVDENTKDSVKHELVQVERQPAVTEAYFAKSGRYKLLTANGELMCVGPIWILWDTRGLPYPLKPDEFEAVFDIVPEAPGGSRRRPRRVEPSQGFRPDEIVEAELREEVTASQQNLERYRTKAKAYKLRNHPEGPAGEPWPVGTDASRWRFWVRAYYHHDVSPPLDPGALAVETHHISIEGRDLAIVRARNHSALGEVTWGER